MGNSKEDLAIKAAMADDERMRKEFDRLIALYRKAPKNKLKLAKKLAVRAAFMAITLDDLEVDISKEGVTEEYKNGANQKGVKKSSKVEVYNVMVKNFSSVIKQLADLLGLGNGGGGDEFDRY